MQFCVIIDVDKISDATAIGMLLQRLGCKIVSAQVTPSNCPLQQEVKPCGECFLVTAGSTPAAESQRAVA